MVLAASQHDPHPGDAGFRSRALVPQERIQSAAVTRIGAVYFETGGGMTAGDHYRGKAVEFRAKAQVESDPIQKAEYEHLARAYLRLAEQAERNSHLDVTYETPAAKDGDPKLKP